jgi:hypothetical protein
VPPVPRLWGPGMEAHSARYIRELHERQRVRYPLSTDGRFSLPHLELLSSLSLLVGRAGHGAF